MPSLDRFDPEIYERHMTRLTGMTEAARHAAIDRVVENHLTRFGPFESAAANLREGGDLMDDDLIEHLDPKENLPEGQKVPADLPEAIRAPQIDSAASQPLTVQMVTEAAGAIPGATSQAISAERGAL